MFRVLLAFGLISLGAVACGNDERRAGSVSSHAPPPTREEEESRRFADAPLAPENGADAAVTTSATPRPSSGYWGIAEGEPLPIRWEDLMPEGAPEALEAEYEDFYRALEARYAADSSLEGALGMIEEGSDMDYMPQLGSFDTVPDLEGVLVRIPGYVVPFDFEPGNRQTEFLFAPYMGACIHTPPPPPNQLIYVEASPAVKVDDIEAAYWLEGTLTSARQDSDLASAAYTLQLTRIAPYSAP